MGAWVAALAFLAASGLYLAGSLQFPLGSTTRPGPGFFPVAVGTFLCVVAIALVLTQWRQAPALAHRGPRLPPDARARVTATMAGLLGFCALLPWIGYSLAAFLFVALLLRRLGGGSWMAVIVAAVASAAASYYLFAIVLAVPLPRGIVLD